ncbi:hypothetical protein JH314_20335 [Xanthomonas campestris]|uniref:OB-fold protein n=1 Tax=Xanthomonas campestris TaxID=339 RepID=UPI0009BFE974|nr:hypothetical protein [Xanthomonas campestris]MEB1152721.1 hypothetical protein [Xanthomonas campestris pv. campestris]MCC5098920.1 OB-fold putative lipoprotein [Xanthomonas campestris]MEA9584718.1 hypothetical protein [Xanthomonas campestris]MEA9593041.1 hypothetical protein [Xanthomonas campestris]MEA9624798.1 hypothetical protein [Xanthomonas campestris]
MTTTRRFIVCITLATAPFAHAQTPIPVAPAELVSEYRANPIAANRRLAGKSVIITGAISGIDEAKPGTAVISFGGAWDGYLVNAYTTEDTAAELSIGQNVTLQCDSVRRGKKFAPDVIAESCRIL